MVYEMEKMTSPLGNKEEKQNRIFEKRKTKDLRSS